MIGWFCVQLIRCEHSLVNFDVSLSLLIANGGGAGLDGDGKFHLITRNENIKIKTVTRKKKVSRKNNSSFLLVGKGKGLERLCVIVMLDQLV